MAERPLGRDDLARTSLVAAALAFGGLPLYVHLPRFYADEMAVGLATLGALLLAARAIDSVQDPLLGWLADRTKTRREIWAGLAITCLAAGFAVLFAPPDWGAALPRLVAGLLLAFTGFSALQLALYDHGLALAAGSEQAHTRVALWREAGGLAGVALAVLAPALLAAWLGASDGFVAFTLLFAVFAAVAAFGMAGHWRASGARHPGAGSFARALSAPGVQAVLMFGFVNALPVAVTSTLFLFFVTDVLQAEHHAGPLLLLFFLSAAAMAPLWANLANRLGRRVTLALSMSLSVVAFVWASLLGPGDVGPFYAVVLASGAALGADMTLAPAMLAARIRDDAGRVFALWTFLQKTALALASGIALPALALAGYDPAGEVGSRGRDALTIAYAVIPCLLKLAAIGALALLPRDSEVLHADT